MSQISTAVSDLVLAVATLLCALRVAPSHIFARIGFGIVGGAASCGVVRYAFSSPPRNIAYYHDLLTWLSYVVGIPLLASTYLYLHSYSKAGFGVACGAVALVVAWQYLNRDVQKALTKAAAGGSIITILVLSFMHVNMYGLVGAGMYLVSALVIGDRGSINGIPRVDLLHYGLVVANFALFAGMYNGTLPINVRY